MKKIILMFFLLSSFMIFKMNVKAEEFYEGDFINGEYINKVVHGKTYYMTMQYIKDRKGNIVYCLEPFSFFSEDSKYNEYVGDLSGYANLSEEQKRKIELIIYYGYGYQNRKDSKWYVITQFMIWKVVSLDSNIYFTDTLNGQKINKYIKEIDEINKDIINHDEVPSFIKDYKVMYEDNLEILNFSDEYEIVNSDYEYKLDKNNLIISNLLESGEIIVRKKVIIIKIK